MKAWNDKPWMEGVNIDLLYRLWVRKGYPDCFNYHGMLWRAKKGDFGTLLYYNSPMFQMNGAQEREEYRKSLIYDISYRPGLS